MIDLQLFKNIIKEGRHNTDLLDSYSPNQFKSKQKLEDMIHNYVDINSKETFYVGNGIRFLQNIEDKNTYENFFSQASNMFDLIDLAIEKKSYVAAEEVSPNYLSGEDHWKKAN